MAPEQFLGQAVDARTDQFAYSVALYEALYGQRPFAGETHRRAGRVGDDRGAARAARRGEGPTSRPGCAPSSMRGLSPRPEQRFGLVEEMVAALSVDPGARTRRGLGAGGRDDRAAGCGGLRAPGQDGPPPGPPPLCAGVAPSTSRITGPGALAAKPYGYAAPGLSQPIVQPLPSSTRRRRACRSPSRPRTPPAGQGSGWRSPAASTPALTPACASPSPATSAPARSTSASSPPSSSRWRSGGVRRRMHSSVLGAAAARNVDGGVRRIDGRRPRGPRRPDAAAERAVVASSCWVERSALSGPPHGHRRRVRAGHPRLRPRRVDRRRRGRRQPRPFARRARRLLVHLPRQARDHGARRRSKRTAARFTMSPGGARFAPGCAFSRQGRRRRAAVRAGWAST